MKTFGQPNGHTFSEQKCFLGVTQISPVECYIDIL